MSQKLGKFLLLAGLIFLAFTLSALAQDLSKRFTSSDYFNFEYVSDPQISPDGKQIVYSSLVLSAPRTIAPPPPLPPGAQMAPPAKIIDRIMYRFDGIGYIPGYLHIFVIPAEGGTPRQLTSGNFNHPDYYSRDIAWTPDGKFIILSANRRENSEVEILDNEVYEISLTDGSIKALTNRKGPDSSPVVSPDGKFIAYLGFDDRYQGHQTTQLYVMNRDGSGPRAVTKSLDRDVSRVNWANDGKGLYFCYDEKGTSYIAYTTLDGKVKQLTGGIGDGRVAYGSGGSYTIAPGGNFAFTLTKPDHPSDIAVGTVLNPKARIITGVNDDILAFKKLGGVEEIWYTSSVDGRKIQGWILKPPDFDPTKKYPLILEIHGGPFASYGDYFDIEKELLASSGYVVLYTNPRGSTSYGEEFANLIHHSYPGDDFYDLNSGVDAVLQKGYIDENNLFVTGGSGGGVLTCWMIGRTNRFRAAAPLYPVINWYSWVLTSDVSGVGVKYWFPGFPWDNVEHFEKRSLLSVVKNVKTPTMIITGEQDFRCPMSESEQYYMALKLLGIEAVLVRFPDESHGIMARPSHHLSKMMHIIAWFDQHKSKK
jgi:acylaminoacyl-peptidase